MKSTPCQVLVLFFLFVHVSYAQSDEQLRQIITDWNRIALEMAEEEDGFLTLKGLRTTTMMHLAVHDALVAINSTYEPYLFRATETEASVGVAMIEAAYTVVLNQFPQHREKLNHLRREGLSLILLKDGEEAGQLLGRRSAEALLNHRFDDGWNTEARYRWHPMGPGVYAEFNEHSGTPEGFIFGAGWGEVRPFGMQRGDQFVTIAPPAIDSEAYTVAFNEVKEVGRDKSSVRTEDQTHLALWWKDFAENAQNRLVRKLVNQEQLGLMEANRLFALLNMSIFDAYVASFYNKFHYNHWRPYTAIRWAAHDGNDDTKADTTWTNTHNHTYAFPSYPSAHGTSCSAAMTALRHVFGKDYAFEMSTHQVDKAGPFSGKITMEPATRSFASFSEAAEECGASRVYLGIHFRYDAVEGVKLGQKVGEYITTHHLLPHL